MKKITINESTFNALNDFYRGVTSKSRTDILMEYAEEEENEQPEVKHIPGRYNYGHHVIFNEQDGEFTSGVVNDTTRLKDSRRLGIACKSMDEAGEICRQQRAYLLLIDKIHELNDGWEPDWPDNLQEKYSFEYSRPRIEINVSRKLQSKKNELYFRYDEIGRTLIKHFGLKLIILATVGIEELTLDTPAVEA